MKSLLKFSCHADIFVLDRAIGIQWFALCMKSHNTDPTWSSVNLDSTTRGNTLRRQNGCHFADDILKGIFSCDQAALWMVQSVCPSVCLSVRPSVCLSHLFDYVPIILSSWNFQELLPVTKVTSMQKVKVRGQRSRSQRSRPKFSFPDCNSSLNSHMMMKWYI